jgi:hypothetical protein
MKYRKFGKLDWNVSVLGFGCMRLPTKGQESDIDDPTAIRMVRYAIDHGVNYVDTAYGYHDGESERFVGRALKDGYRKKVRVATKLPVWEVEKADDFDRLLNEQLGKLDMEHIDFYLLHALNKDSWSKVHRLGVLKWAEDAIADGRIGHLGFSFHDRHETFIEIVDTYDGWDFCQIQYNYQDIDIQAGTKGLQHAASKGLAVIIMEPIRGGRLTNPPQAIQDLWDTAEAKRTPADWALQWVWNQPEVTLALSGMSIMEHVEQNLASADASGPNTLTQDELALIAQVRDKYLEVVPVPCTGCLYCMPCPNGVEIPGNFEVYNEGAMFDRPEEARRRYVEWFKEDARASACIQCRECEELCPQQILISEWMIPVHEVLGEGKPFVFRLT